MSISPKFNIDDVSLYRPCKLKQYKVKVCMPPRGTVVVNKYDSADASKYFANGELYLRATQHINLFNTKQEVLLNDLILKGVVELVGYKGKDIVMCGESGSLSCITSNALKSNFVSDNGENLTEQKLRKGWVTVKRKSVAKKFMALFVDLKYQFKLLDRNGVTRYINKPGISHGKGDFIICNVTANGTPDLTSRWVVNGHLFSEMYDVHGWLDCVESQSSEKVKLPVLCLPRDKYGNLKDTYTEEVAHALDKIVDLFKLHKEYRVWEDSATRDRGEPFSCNMDNETIYKAVTHPSVEYGRGGCFEVQVSYPNDEDQVVYFSSGSGSYILAYNADEFIDLGMSVKFGGN